MKITGSIPRSRRMPSLRNVVMIDTVRGVLRVRKWPKKRGTPRSALQRWWIDWFRQANLLAKYVDGASQARAIALTKGSGLYPRDVLLKAMRGRLYHFIDQDGNKWFPMAGIQDISDTLDMLAQTVGSVLVRATDRWRAPPAGTPGDVLTYQSAADPPEWVTPTGGGGYLGGALVSKSADQTIPNAAWTDITWNQESYDTAAIHDNVVDNDRLTVPAGFNRVSLNANAYMLNYAGGFRILNISKNDDYVIGGGVVRHAGSGVVEPAINVQSAILEVIPGDYFKARVYQNRGGNVTLIAHASTYFSMQLISAL